MLRGNEAHPVRKVIFFFIHRNGNHFSHVKPVLNATFELRDAEEQGVLDCSLQCINTHTHTHITHTEEVKPRGSWCLLPLEIGVCVQTTSLGIRLTAQSLEHRKHLPNVEQFSSP